MGREVLDIAAAAAKPGVTTDYIDEIVHKACLERNVSILSQDKSNLLIILVLPFSPQLLRFPKVCLHIRQRSHLPWYSRQAGLERW